MYKMVSLPHGLVKDINAVLASAPKGVALHRFPKDYQQLTKSPLPYRQHGYDKPLSLLLDLEKKEIVSIDRSKIGEWRVYSRGYDSYMPSWVAKLSKKPATVPVGQVGVAKVGVAKNKDVAKQGKKKHNYLLCYDNRGWVSLFVFWKYKDKNLELSPVELHNKLVSLV